MPAKPQDKTTPKYKAIHKRVGEAVLHWGEELEEAFRRKRAHSPVPSSKKRQPDVDGGEPSKKVKTEEVLEDDEIEAHVQSETLSKLTVSQLKAWLSKKGVHASGKKAELVEAVKRKCN